MRFTPSLLLAYFLPALLSAAGVFSAKHSKLPDAAARFLLPASLTLLTLSTDLASITTLGPRVLWCFFAATASIVISGPFAMLLVGTWDRYRFRVLSRGLSVMQFVLFCLEDHAALPADHA